MAAMVLSVRRVVLGLSKRYARRLCDSPSASGVGGNIVGSSGGESVARQPVPSRRSGNGKATTLKVLHPQLFEQLVCVVSDRRMAITSGSSMFASAPISRDQLMVMRCSGFPSGSTVQLGREQTNWIRQYADTDTSLDTLPADSKLHAVWECSAECLPNCDGRRWVSTIAARTRSVKRTRSLHCPVCSGDKTLRETNPSAYAQLMCLVSPPGLDGDAAKEVQALVAKGAQVSSARRRVNDKYTRILCRTFPRGSAADFGEAQAEWMKEKCDTSTDLQLVKARSSALAVWECRPEPGDDASSFCGTRWIASVYQRQKTGCPQCATVGSLKKVSPSLYAQLECVVSEPDLSADEERSLLETSKPGRVWYNRRALIRKKYRELSQSFPRGESNDVAAAQDTWMSEHGAQRTDAENLTAVSHRYVVWQCRPFPGADEEKVFCGRRWTAPVHNRFNANRVIAHQCPYCARSGTLKALYPELFAQIVVVVKVNEGSKSNALKELAAAFPKGSVDDLGHEQEKWIEEHKDERFDPRLLTIGSGRMVVWEHGRIRWVQMVQRRVRAYNKR